MAGRGLGGLSVLADAGSENVKKINRLLSDIDRNGYQCTGKPEALSGSAGHTTGINNIIRAAAVP